MDYAVHTLEQLAERITELETLNKELLAEKEQETRLDFAWSGNLGHWYWNVITNSVVFNQLKVSVLGYSMEDLPQIVNYQFFTDKLHPDDYQNTMNAMLLHMQGKASVYETEYRIQAKDKSWKWFYDRGKITQRDANGKPELISGIVFDITARKEQELNLKKENDSIYNELTSVDKLTNSYNINAFKRKAELLLEDTTSKYAFILLDIDNFKLINDLFGFDQGDLLLKHIAGVLSHQMGLHEVFAHVTGDIFYILAEYVSKEALGRRLEKITEDILTFKFVSEPNFKMAVISGVFIIENSNISIETMSDRARLAARKMKGTHTSLHGFYNDDIRTQVIHEHEVESEMHQALKNNDFKVYLQPKYDFKVENIVGAEALVRWFHPIKGIIQPNLFIPLFEKNGFVTKIDMFVFEEICKKQQKWTAESRKPLIISINQSRLHLYNLAYIDSLKALIEKYDVNPGLMELELTESAFFGDRDIIFDVTRRLHEIGFRLSIDDFGSGYSSLNLLKDIFVDVVKLDREFFTESLNTARGKKIILSIVSMAKDLGIETVAEGVETMDQVEFLREIGCDVAQGFYFGKPMSIAEFEALLAKTNT
ncbi:EAL domain-containing protein [uncultured Sphaerochaeta sp.]|uniref:putative bifunctional diguanylate cyclase/phosphodiesterase n=1 Tax=uncultured Sphaerochaeta sp. TaxID=886478 RepID=UPI002A0A8674|nr:EAL domain-containing protein [uncultured Sphaerochaeta sp.]